MKYSFTIGQIKEAIDNGGKGVVSFKKKELSLREDTRDTTYATSMNDLDDAIASSKTKEAVISKGDTNSNKAQQTPTIDINATNIGDAKKEIEANNKNPKYNALGDLNYHVTIGESRNEIPFTKRELNEMLKG